MEVRDFSAQSPHAPDLRSRQLPLEDKPCWEQSTVTWRHHTKPWRRRGESRRRRRRSWTWMRPRAVRSPISRLLFLRRNPHHPKANGDGELMSERRSVIVKLLGFTFAMITFPIGSYFLTVNSLFGGMRSSRCVTVFHTWRRAHVMQATRRTQEVWRH